MTTTKFVQPNRAAQSGTTYCANIDDSTAVLANVAAAFAPRAADTPNMTVVVDAGYFHYGGSAALIAQQVASLAAAPASDYRIDRVVLTGSATTAVVTGTVAAAPTVPAIPTGTVPLARVAVNSGATSILNSNITDERAFLGLEATRRAGVSSGDVFLLSSSALAVPFGGTGTQSGAITLVLSASLTAGATSTRTVTIPWSQHTWVLPLYGSSSVSDGEYYVIWTYPGSLNGRHSGRRAYSYNDGTVWAEPSSGTMQFHLLNPYAGTQTCVQVLQLMPAITL